MVEENGTFRKSLRELPLDPKRRVSTAGIDGWYPYYAGFSLDFAQKVLSQLRLTRSHRVLDPWNGSGTTTFAAATLGTSGIGVDINPFAGLIASAKLAKFESKAILDKKLKAILSVARSKKNKDEAQLNDPLSAWLPYEVVRQMRRLENATWLVTKESPGRCLLDVVPSSEVAFFLLCLIKAGRQFALKRNSNPTWSKPDPHNQATSDALCEAFSIIVRDLSEEAVEASASALHRSPQIKIGDARDLPVTDSSIDVVLTSPPYCTRIDYAVTSCFELAALGVASDSEVFGNLRRAMMGTTTVRQRKPADIPEHWARETKELLIKIKNHPSYSSGMYYYKNLWQYFEDAHVSLREICRKLRVGGLGILVLQTSFYKEISIDLPRLFVAMAETTGLSAAIVRRFPVSRVMTSVNTGSRRYLDRRSYYESIVLVERTQ